MLSLVRRMRALRPPTTLAGVAAARRALAVVSPLGWAVATVSAGCWVLAACLDWVELGILALTGLTLLGLCALLTLARARLDVTVEVEPRRVTVGQPAAGRLAIVNRARGALLPIDIDLPIGAGAVRFTLPLLRPGARHDELFVVPTDRRGVYAIGPARSMRGDPLGFVRRQVEWTEVIELFVHPTTVPLDSLGTGLLRDLEGTTTNAVSMSDLAFHSLRDYVPGDDRRHIHWRSTAKATAASPDTQRFLVREFLDTRRSHFATVVDGRIDSYRDEQEFEIAISVAASIAVQALADEQDLSIAAGDIARRAEPGRRALDPFARAEYGGPGLAELAGRLLRVSPHISLAVLITGSHATIADLRLAATRFPTEAPVVALRINTETPTFVQGLGDLTLLSLNTLTDLPLLLSGGIA